MYLLGLDSDGVGTVSESRRPVRELRATAVDVQRSEFVPEVLFQLIFAGSQPSANNAFEAPSGGLFI